MAKEIKKMTKADCISELTNNKKAFNKKDTVAQLRSRVEALRKDLEAAKKPANTEVAPMPTAEELDKLNDPPCSVFAEQDLNQKDCQACLKAFPNRAEACTAATALRASTKPVKPRKSGVKRDSASKQLIQDMLSEGKHTRAQIIKAYLDAFPEKAKSTVMTYLSDSKNPKYSAFRNSKGERLLTEEDKETKAMRFIG